MIINIRQKLYRYKRKVQKFTQWIWRSIRPMKSEYRHRYKMSIRQWMLYNQRTVHFDNCKWMGIKALKNPLDAWIYQELIFQVKPDVIVEIGSLYGGSTLFLANMLDLLGKGLVISIDINRNSFQAIHERIIIITGNSSSPDIVNEVETICQDKKVMVIHDGDHQKPQVLEDLRAYWNLVSLDSYFIVEDGIIDLFKPGDSIGSIKAGPLVAIEDFLEENDNFVVDLECERFLITYNPKGYLKRIK